MCTAAKKYRKNPQKFFFDGSWSFKVIDLDKTKKPVTSACYDKQYVYTYLQRFLHRRANSGK